MIETLYLALILDMSDRGAVVIPHVVFRNKYECEQYAKDVSTKLHCQPVHVFEYEYWKTPKTLKHEIIPPVTNGGCFDANQKMISCSQSKD